MAGSEFGGKINLLEAKIVTENKTLSIAQNNWSDKTSWGVFPVIISKISSKLQSKHRAYNLLC